MRISDWSSDVCSSDLGVSDEIISTEDQNIMMRAARSVVPHGVLMWIRSLPLSRRIGDYLFVHAGVRPGVPLDQQDPADLRWIRRDFLDSEEDHGAIIVHGPSVRPEVEDRKRVV